MAMAWLAEVVTTIVSCEEEAFLPTDGCFTSAPLTGQAIVRAAVSQARCPHPCVNKQGYHSAGPCTTDMQPLTEGLPSAAQPLYWTKSTMFMWDSRNSVVTLG